MLDKLREALQAKESLDAVRAQLDAQATQLKACNEAIGMLTNEWAAAKGKHDALATSITKISTHWEEHARAMNAARKALETELSKFVVLKHELQTQVMDRFENELKNHFGKHSEELRIATDNYKQLKTDVENAARMLTSLHSSVERLQSVASTIRKEDFEMSKFASQVFRADKEKLELMQKIDTMERLVGALRRKMPL